MDKAFMIRFRANAIGNFLEFFDFAAFGAVADIISDQFFSHDVGTTVSMLETLCIFGVAFMMRPLGGLLMGYIGDTYGRQKSLEISIVLMVLPSFLIGCLPPYSVGGQFSIFALVLLRLAQGLACGGEIVGAYIHTLEAAAPEHRSFWGGAIKATGNLGSATGLGVAAILRWQLTHEQMHSWGWRVPFFCGLILGCIAVYLRYAHYSDSHSWTFNAVIDDVNNHTNTMFTQDEQLEESLTRRSPSAPSFSEAGSNPLHSPAAGSTANAPPARDQSNSGKLALDLAAMLDQVKEGSVSVKGRKDATAPTPAPTPARNYTHADTLASYSAVYAPLIGNNSNPLKEVCSDHISSIITVILLTAYWGVGYYTICVWNGYFLTSNFLNGHALPEAWTWGMMFGTNLVLVASLTVGGFLGDIFGPTNAQVGYIGLLLVLAVPAYMMLSSGDMTVAAVGQVMLCVCVGKNMIAIHHSHLHINTTNSFLLNAIRSLSHGDVSGLYGGVLPYQVCRLFPKPLRYSGVGIGYNLAHAIFSSTCSIIQTMLVLSGRYDDTDNTTTLSAYIYHNKDPSLPHPSIFHRLYNDGRLRPAYYLQLYGIIAIVVLLSSTSRKAPRGSMYTMYIESHGAPTSEGKAWGRVTVLGEREMEDSTGAASGKKYEAVAKTDHGVAIVV